MTATLQYIQMEFGEGTYVVKYGDRRAKNTILEGDSGSLKDVYDLALSSGRWFNDTDDDHHSPVILLGSDTADELFPDGDPLDKEINIDGQMFTVIGVAAPVKGVFSGGKNPNNNIVYFPLSTFRKLHPELKQYWITIKATSHEDMPKAMDEMREVLRRRRKVPPDKPDNFVHPHAGFAFRRLESDYRRGLHLHVRGVERGIGRRRRRRNEHHAGFGDGANARNRSAQSHRSPQARHPAAIHAGGDHFDRDGRNSRRAAGSDDYLDDSRHLETHCRRECRCSGPLSASARPRSRVCCLAFIPHGKQPIWIR